MKTHSFNSRIIESAAVFEYWNRSYHPNNFRWITITIENMLISSDIVKNKRRSVSRLRTHYESQLGSQNEIKSIMAHCRKLKTKPPKGCATNPQCLRSNDVTTPLVREKFVNWDYVELCVQTEFRNGALRFSLDSADITLSALRFVSKLCLLKLWALFSGREKFSQRNYARIPRKRSSRQRNVLSSCLDFALRNDWYLARFFVVVIKCGIFM